MLALEDDSIFDLLSDDEDDGVVVDINNLNTAIQVSPIPTTRIHKDHPLDQVIGDLQSATQTKKMSKNLEEHGFVITIQQRTNHKDLQNCLLACFLSQEEPKKTLVDLPNGKRAIGSKWVLRNKKDEMGIVIRNKARLVAQRMIEEEVYACQPPGFEDPDFPDRVYKLEKALHGLHQALRAWYKTLSTYLLDNRFQIRKIDKTLFIKRHKGDILLVKVYVADIIFSSTKKEQCIAFERLMHEKFQMSSMRELAFFLELQVKQNNNGIFISQDKYVAEILKKVRFTEVKTTSISMATQQPLLKDKDGEEVDVHMYRSMIGSLLYLASSRPDIMFVACVCVRNQVIQSIHYSDYAGASLDRKSTTRGCQFFGCRLISWQCKKQTVVANSTIEAEYVAASRKTKKRVRLMMEKLFGMEFEFMLFWSTAMAKTINGEAQLHALVDGKEIIVTESSIRRDLQLVDEEGIDCLPNSTIFEQITLMGLGEVASKQGRINAIDADKEIILVSVQDEVVSNDADKEMFDVNVLDGDEVFVAEHEIIIDAAQVSVAGDIVSTLSAATTISVATITTPTITTVGDITLAQALEKIKSTKPKEKGIVIQELGKSTTTKSSQQSQDKGKGILIRPVKPMKRKDQTRLDEEAALKLQAVFEEEERLAREKAEKNMEGYKLKDLKLKEFDSIQEMLDRAFKRVNTFEDFRTELVEGKEKIVQRSKREDLYKLVKAKYESTRPMEDLDLLLWEKKYPLTPPTLSIMLEKKLIVEYESEMAYRLLRFVMKQLKKKQRLLPRTQSSRSSVEQVATSPAKTKKPIRARQKRMIQSDDAPGQVAWTTEKELCWLKGGSKRHKSSGSSSFNIESREASINMNTNVGDNDEDKVQEIRRTVGDCLSCSDVCSARMCAGYDPCKAAKLMLFAVVCRLYLSWSGRCSLRLCAGYTSRGAAHGSSQLFIFPSFHRLMRGLDTCLSLNVCGVFLRGLSYPLVFAFVLEMVGNSIYTVTSVLTQRDLDQYCATFGIPVELRPELPDRNAIIKDSPERKIGMYTRFIKFANYRIPLLKFILCVLEYYHINLSQLSVIGATKDPLSIDEAVDLPCVEWLNENRTLLRKYPETFLCLVGLSRSFIKTDVRPTLLYDNDEEMGLLDYVKSADPFKVKVGEWTLAENKDELNINSSKRKKRVAFVSGSPPVKKARAEGIVVTYSRPSTAGNSYFALRRLSRQNEQADTGSGSAASVTEDVASSSVTHTPERILEDASHDNVRTRPPFGRFVILSSGSADTDIPASPQVVSPVTSAPTDINAHVVEYVGDGRCSSSFGPEAGAFSATPSQDASAKDFYESQTIDSASALNVYVPNWNVTNNARIDNPTIFWNLLDHVTPPGYWAALRNQHDTTFLDAVNINSAQHVCMISKLRLRYEHEITTKKNLRRSLLIVLQSSNKRDAKIADLKARLEKSEAKAAEVIELRKHVSDLEATVAIKVGELANFHTKNDTVERHFMERAAELDARIADVRRDMDNDLYPHMLTTIAGRRWVVRHDFRLAVYKCARSIECRSALGKAGRSLAQVKAYDPDVEGKYVVAVSEFEGISFPLLDELESLKDNPLALIIFAFTLKDDQGNKDAAPEFTQFQPSIDQFIVPVYSESDFVEREMLLFDAILAIRQFAMRRGLCPPSSSAPGRNSGLDHSYDSSLGITGYQVSTLVMAGDGGSTNQPPVTQPHDDLFYTSVLNKPGDV
nr:hypothetical protein [Tanacetum cinerariifolium]